MINRRFENCLIILMIVFVGLVFLTLCFSVVISAGIISPITEEDALSQAEELFGTDDVVIVSHDSLDWDTMFTIRVRDVPYKLDCVKSFNIWGVNTACAATFMEFDGALRMPSVEKE